MITLQEGADGAEGTLHIDVTATFLTYNSVSTSLDLGVFSDKEIGFTETTSPTAVVSGVAADMTSDPILVQMTIAGKTPTQEQWDAMNVDDFSVIMDENGGDFYFKLQKTETPGELQLIPMLNLIKLKSSLYTGDYQYVISYEGMQGAATWSGSGVGTLHVDDQRTIWERYAQIIIKLVILAAIVIRIPPLSRKKDRYYNGVEQTAAMRKSSKYSKDTMKKAVAASTTKVSQTPYSIFVTSIPGVLSFTVKIVTFVQALATIALFISNYTPFFDWIGMPMVPYLELCQMPDAAAIAPATLVGIAEIALPVMTIAGMNIAPMSNFLCYRAVYRADHLLYGERERNDAERSESEVPGAGPDFPDPYSDRHSDRSGIRPRSVLNGLRKF